MKKLILTLTAAGLLLAANAVQADNDDDFVTDCNDAGGTTVRDLYVVSLYSFGDSFGFAAIQDSSVGNKKLSLSRRTNSEQDSGDDDMLTILENAYTNQLSVDVCLNSSTTFSAVEESEEQ